jgi:hypothetical protein
VEAILKFSVSWDISQGLVKIFLDNILKTKSLKHILCSSYCNTSLFSFTVILDKKKEKLNILNLHSPCNSVSSGLCLNGSSERVLNWASGYAL